jgi:hypothetical protein
MTTDVPGGLSARFALAGSRAAGPSRAWLFAAACTALALLAAALAGLAPLWFSIVTVFLFAGPHNWMEFRYFLAKMPAHWGPLRRFFLTAIGGVVVLSALFISYPILARHFRWTSDAWNTASSVWNSALVLWIATLVYIHLAPRKRGFGDWAFPAAFALVALAWYAPQAWDLALVYLHPLVALWFLDRELARRRPKWLAAYRLCLTTIPILLAALWWRLADAPPLAGQDMLSMRITQHAGAGVLRDLSPHALVSTHTFLEMLHYGVWIVAIPLIGLRTVPWKLQSAPLVRRSIAWRRGVIGVIVLGLAIVLILWTGFLANYPLTRDIYFTVAIAHVLAEVPFLLRTF